VQERELYSQLIKEITPDDINRQFHEIWGHDSRLISVTGDAQPGVLPNDKILNTFKSSLFEPVATYQKISPVPFPYLPIPESENNPISSDFFSKIAVERYVFGNGLVLNLKKTDFSENTVQLTVNFGHGELGELVPGMAMIAEDVINRSGSGKLTKSQLADALAGSSADIRFSIKDSSFVWSGSGLMKDFDQLLQLLYTFLRDPGLRENVFESVKSSTRQMYQRIDRDIDGAMVLQVQPFLASGNPHFGLPPWETVKSIDFKKLSAWVDTFPLMQGMEISVVGDFNKEQVIKGIKTCFSGLELAKGNTVEPTVVLFPEGGNRVIEVETSIEKSNIIVAWPSEDFWDINRTRRLRLLASVFEDRIRKVIREKWGATYSPAVYSSNNRTYKGYGFLAAQMVVKPGEENKIIDEILLLAEELRIKGVTEEELARAKEPMITSISDSLQENNYWLYSVLSESSKHPEQLEWPTTIHSDYSSITADEINLLAKKYMVNEKAATAIVKPLKGGKKVVGERQGTRSPKTAKE